MTALSSAPAARRREHRPGRDRRPLLVAVPLVLLLSACGTADENTSSPPPSTADGYGDRSAAQGDTASPDTASPDATSTDAGTVTHRVAEYFFPDLALNLTGVVT